MKWFGGFTGGGARNGINQLDCVHVWVYGIRGLKKQEINEREERKKRKKEES